MGFGSTVEGGTALVVGGGGGIGRGFVDHLLGDPRFDHVITTLRDPLAAQRLERELAAGERLSTQPLDVRNEAEMARAIDRIREAHPTLDLVLYCVGLLHDDATRPEKSLRQLERDQLLRYFEVNAIGAGLLAKHVSPLMRRERPSVLASISAKVGSIADNRLGGWHGYRASKAALNMLMKGTAIEYRRTNPSTIVTVLHPGTTDTGLSRPFQRGVPAEKLFAVTRTVSQLMAVIDDLGPAQHGSFLSWDGSALPW